MIFFNYFHYCILTALHPVASTSYVPGWRNGFIDSDIKEPDNHAVTFVFSQWPRNIKISGS